MPSDDAIYTAIGGGRLKLKGNGTSDGRIEKKKRKKREKPAAKQSEGPSTAAASGSKEQTPTAASDAKGDTDSHMGADMNRKTDTINTDDDRQGGTTVLVGKTEAEKRYEEQRRRRLEDRLKREGIKTHKERVEEFNKYLSGLSEHHDMPKIGPG